MEQRCSKCEIFKDVEKDFGKGNKKNGTSSWCKACEKNRHDAWYRRPEVKNRAIENERKRKKRNPERAMFVHVRDNARRKGIPFNLTIEDCQIPEVCPVFGIPLVSGQIRVKGMVPDNTPSMDKCDPDKGYIKGNVSVISWRANHLKNNATLAELEAITAYVRRNS